MHTLADIAALVGGTLPPAARGDTVIRGLNTLADAGPDELSFLASEQYGRHLPGTKAAAVLVPRKVKLRDDLVPATAVLVVVDDADVAMMRVAERFAPPVPRPPAGVDPSARVAASATLGEGCQVGPNVVVGERATLGARCVLHAGAFVGNDSVLGDDCELFQHAVVRERVTAGSRVVLHAGAVVGTDGFGFKWDGKRHAKIPQIGTVVLEDDVEIGSCACVDRARFAETRIGRGTKIDNLVQIGHNVRTGPHCILAGQSGVAGTTTLGAGVVLGGRSAVRDHVTIGDGAMLAACSGVMDDVPPKQIMSGLPALPHRQSLREQAAFRELPDLRVQVRKLQEQVDKLQQRLDGEG
jgi:UDP-3-O-[3-hydroxymyristoyl] glucosamine N-acyltransferase